MKRAKVLKWVGIMLGVAVLLFAVLVVHIALVSKPDIPNSSLVLARIDLKENVDVHQAQTLKSTVLNMEGVHNVVVNPTSKTLVYGYYRDKQNEEEVYQNLIGTSSIKMKRFIPSASDKAKSCPALSKTSFTYRVGQAIKAIFS